MRADPLGYLSVELDTLKQQGLYRHLRILDDEQKPKTTFDHRLVVNLSSNNYLGLTTHPRLREAALEATRRFGVGSGSVRTIAGTMEIHMELERRLAEFKKTEAVVVFQSGFAANAGTVAAVLTKDDVVVSDELNHASIIDGSPAEQARRSRCFRTRMSTPRERCSRACRATQRKLLITDGVFSMDGDLGAVPALCALAEEFGCIMMVDDAHASGVFGKNGRGTIDHFNVHGRVDIQVGTLSKAIGALGGYVAGIAGADRIPVSPRPAVPLLDVASAGGRRRLHRRDRRPHDEPQIIDRLWDNTQFFKAGLQALGFNTGFSESPITPVIAGEGALAMRLSDRLFQEGVFAQGIAFPTVARDKARVRTIVTATHTREELQFALDVFAKVGRELGIISGGRSSS